VGKEIDSEALVLLRRGLGIAGVAGPSTLLEEDAVIQTVDVGQFARQGLPPGKGIFNFLIRIITSVANPALTALIDPYEPTAVAVDLSQAPYPNPVPAAFDLWLINCGLQLDDSTFTSAQLQLIYPVGAIGVAGQNADSATNVVTAVTPASQAQTIAGWDSDFASVGRDVGTLGGTGILQPLGFRIIRGTTLQLRVSAGGINTVDCTILAALMPAAMGQDVGV